LLDANGSALAGVSVTFTLGADGGASGASGAGNTGAGASFTSGASQVVVTTDSSGIAVSPHFVADSTAGHFTATATLTGGTKVATFALGNRAGTPRRVTAGAAASESARTGTRFPIRLGVVVTDADANPVPGVLVTFSAPVRGASGTFERSGNGRTRVVRVRTNALGIAVAPVFTANRARGGYIVKASTGQVVTAFALVNEPLEQPT
jgi:adhesin/invasin